jgi:hypothetical protein
MPALYWRRSAVSVSLWHLGGLEVYADVAHICAMTEKPKFRPEITKEPSMVRGNNYRLWAGFPRR